MIPIYKMKLIQIELTNSCINQCANCTRFVGHHKKPFFMDLDTFNLALDSLEGYEGGIGIMGGEPTLHPQFAEICKIFRDKVPNRRKRELWTAGYKWEEYEPIIRETFDEDLISFNNHQSDDGKHTPLLTAINDLVDDPSERNKIINNCWVQQRWSASITPYGCYFCEIAGAYDILCGGGHGYPIQPGWWKREPKDFQDQVEAICGFCGANLPIGEQSDHATYDTVSRTNLMRLKRLGSPKMCAGNYALYTKKWTLKEIKEKSKNWKPANWRNHYEHTPQDHAAYQRKNTDKK